MGDILLKFRKLDNAIYFEHSFNKITIFWSWKSLKKELMANRYQNVNAQLKSNYNLDVISAKKNIKSMKEHIYSLIQST